MMVLFGSNTNTLSSRILRFIFDAILLYFGWFFFVAFFSSYFIIIEIKSSNKISKTFCATYSCAKRFIRFICSLQLVFFSWWSLFLDLNLSKKQFEKKNWNKFHYSSVLVNCSIFFFVLFSTLQAWVQTKRHSNDSVFRLKCNDTQTNITNCVLVDNFKELKMASTNNLE